MKKRILAFCLALLCVFNLIVPVEVDAAEKSKEVFEDGHPLHNAGVLWNWLCARIEGVTFSGDWYDLVGNSLDTMTSFKDLLLDSWNNGDITQDSSGNLKFNTNFITGFETVFKNVMRREPRGTKTSVPAEGGQKAAEEFPRRQRCPHRLRGNGVGCSGSEKADSARPRKI